MEPSYVYRATCKRPVDGDTFVADVDLGFGASIEIKVRLHGVNAPEKNTPEGKAAGEYLATLLAYSGLILKSYKDARSFERWVCDVWVAADPTPVVQHIIDSGHGVPFMV